MIHDDTVTSQPLLSATTAWNGTTYAPYPAGVPELTVRRMTIPAHTALRWHSHPMPSVAYLVSGELTVEEPGGVRRRMVAGEAFAETVGTAHRGVAGAEPVVVVVFYAGVQGMPLATERLT
jgi:quercetin dioxygenase-like cupin family protein